MQLKTVECEVERLLAVIGGKWKVLILRELFNGPRRHAQLCRALPGIRQKVLTAQLRELELDGAVSRKVPGRKTTARRVFADALWGTVARTDSANARSRPAKLCRAQTPATGRTLCKNEPGRKGSPVVLERGRCWLENQMIAAIYE